ncbi:MAG: RDD family protein [Myxococcota bacterium]
MTAKASPKKSAGVDIVPPEAVRLRFPLAPVLSRMVAFFVDCGIIVILMVLVLMLAFALRALTAVWVVLFFVLQHFYFTFFEWTWNGTTPGKRALGLRVISLDGGALSLEAVVARNLMRDVEVFGPGVALLAPEVLLGSDASWLTAAGGLWTIVIALLPLTTAKHQRAGDLLGGTVVISDPVRIPLADEVTARTQPELTLHFSREALSIYGEEELEALVEFMRQIDAGQTTFIDQRHIATTIAKKIGYAGTEPHEAPIRFLRSFYRAQRSALEEGLLYGERKASKFAAKRRGSAGRKG